MLRTIYFALPAALILGLAVDGQASARPGVGAGTAGVGVRPGVGVGAPGVGVAHRASVWAIRLLAVTSPLVVTSPFCPEDALLRR